MFEKTKQYRERKIQVTYNRYFLSAFLKDLNTCGRSEDEIRKKIY